MLSPKQAYEKAIIEGPSSDTRKAVLSDAKYSYCYALYVDQYPRDDTMNAVLSSPKYSYWYALSVDKCPRDDIRKTVLYDAYYSYSYALDVDKIIFRDSNYDIYFVDIHNIGMRWIREYKLNIGFMSIGCFCLNVL